MSHQNNGTEAIEQKIYKTTNYDQFIINEANRPIKDRRVRQLAEAIEKKNLLDEYPIDVTDRMEVMDGQHRLAAAELLKLPIYYRFTELTIVDTREAGRLREKWGLGDYLHHYCKLQHPEYIKLQEFLDKYPFVSVPQALAWVQRWVTVDQAVRQAFEAGEFVFSEQERVTRIAEAILDFEPIFQYYKHRSFGVAISRLLESPKYDHKVMMSKAAEYHMKMFKCPDANSYIDMLEEVYNYRRPKKSYVSFREMMG